MFKLKLKTVLTGLLVPFILLSSSGIGLAQSPDPLVELAGTVSVDLGSPAATPPGKSALDPASVVIVLTPRNEAAYEALAIAVSDPQASRYRQPVTDAEYRQNYAPDPASVNNLKNYFAGQGLTLNYESPSQLMLGFSGTQAQLDHIFNTSSEYRTDKTGESGLINVSSLKLPLSVAKNIKGVIGFDQLHRAKTASNPGKSGITPDSFSTNTPTTYRTTYNLPSAYNGAGTNPAITLWGAPNTTDLGRWKTAYGITGTVTLIGSNTSPTTDDDLRFEANMDVQMTLTAAPGASVQFFVASTNTFAALATNLQTAIDAHVSTISNSWGVCELSTNTYINSYHTIFTNAAAQGIPVFFSSGDSGIFECHSSGYDGLANFPATDTLVTAVGGTALDRNPGTNAWQNETAWSCPTTNDNLCLQSTSGSGGGGQSIYYARPAYQAAITPPVEAKFTSPQTNTRLIPDISTDGDPATGQVIYGTYFGTGATNTDVYTGGGTSASSPFLAGITALAVQKRGGPVGSINTFIYNQFPGAWGFDVTSGYNGVYAHTGWDYTTGLGSIKDASAFVNGFVAYIPPVITFATPGTVVAGGPDFTLNVRGTGFLSGAAIKWGNSSPATTFVSANLLTAAIPASYITAPGNISITVVNPASAPSNSATLVINNGCLAQVVYNTDDTNSCGQLRYAINNTSSGGTINIALSGTPTITLKASTDPLTVQKGVTINGICGANGPALTVNGSAPTNNLVLSGGDTLFGLKISGFGARLKVLSGGAGANKFSCTSVHS